MGNQSSAPATPVLHVVRASTEIVAGRWAGVVKPEPIPEQEPENVESMTLEEKLGDVVEVNKGDKPTQPEYLCNDALSLEQRFSIALHMADVVGVLHCLADGADANMNVKESTGSHWAKESPIAQVVAVSAASDAFVDSGLSQNHNFEGTNYYRQVYQEDTINCIKVLLRAGATVSTQALEEAEKESFSKPRTNVLRLLKLFVSAEERAKHPVLLPNTEPLVFKMDVEEVIQGEGEPGQWQRNASDLRTEGDLRLGAGQPVIMFTDANGHWDIWAAPQTRSTNPINTLLYSWGAMDNKKANIAPSVVALDLFRSMSFDTMSYRVNGAIQFLHADGGVKDSDIVVNVDINALDTWNDVTVTYPNEALALEGFRREPRASVDQRVNLQYGRPSRPLSLIGTITGVTPGEDGEAPVFDAKFHWLEPTLLTEAHFQAYCGLTATNAVHWLTYLGDLPDDVPKAEALTQVPRFVYGLPRASNKGGPKAIDGLYGVEAEPMKVNRINATRNSRYIEFSGDGKYKVELAPAVPSEELIKSTPPGRSVDYSLCLMQELLMGSVPVTGITSSDDTQAKHEKISLGALVAYNDITGESWYVYADGSHSEALEGPLLIDEKKAAAQAMQQAQAAVDTFGALNPDQKRERKLQRATAFAALHRQLTDLVHQAKTNHLTRDEFMRIVQAVTVGATEEEARVATIGDGLTAAFGAMQDFFGGLQEGVNQCGQQ